VAEIHNKALETLDRAYKMRDQLAARVSEMEALRQTYTSAEVAVHKVLPLEKSVISVSERLASAIEARKQTEHDIAVARTAATEAK